MSGYVCVDASVAVKWVIAEDETTLALSLHRKAWLEQTAIAVPPHLKIEVTSTIRKHTALGRYSHESAKQRLGSFETLPLQVIEPPNLYREALEIAERYGRPTAYDAHYIALAQFLGCEFWTADYGLVNALGGRLPFVRGLREFGA